MALIKCHECSGQISDHARTCPQCGAPVIATIKRRQKAALIDLGIRLGFTAVVVIIVWVTFHRLMNKAMAPLKAIQQQQQSH
jgi:predicted nucleic acid-binding Zn ribbon protein